MRKTEALTFNVITSYSIHYTKLYELLGYNRIIILRFSIQPFITLIRQPAKQVFKVSRCYIRITSYNVCYTKLLRLSHSK